MKDPTRPNLRGEIIFTRFIENGIEKMHMEVYNTYNGNDFDSDIPDYLTIPEGAYTFVKQ